MYPKPASNQDKLNYLEQILALNASKNDKQFRLYYTLSLLRFGVKIPILYREPAANSINTAILRFSGFEYKPDYIVIELFTGRSRKVKNPLAVIKLKY